MSTNVSFVLRLNKLLYMYKTTTKNLQLASHRQPHYPPLTSTPPLAHHGKFCCSYFAPSFHLLINVLICWFYRFTTPATPMPSPPPLAAGHPEWLTESPSTSSLRTATQGRASIPPPIPTINTITPPRRRTPSRPSPSTA